VPIVERFHDTLSHCKFSFELILVGNYVEGSDDETPVIVSQLAQRWPNVHAVIQAKKGMMGWDMRSGLAVARGHYIGVIDGDEQFPHDAVVDCLEKAEREGLDLVKTYRVTRADSLYRRLISHVFNVAFGLLFGGGLRDVNAKPKVLRRDKYLLLQLTADDWFIDAEIMIQALELGFKIGEVPVRFNKNNYRPSFVKPWAMLEFTVNLLRYRLRRSHKGPRAELR
jgi:dolichol-phosphate mannosyltransferase